MSVKSQLSDYIQQYIIAVALCVKVRKTEWSKEAKIAIFNDPTHNGRWKSIQSQPRSLILVLIESACATSYWQSIATLVLSCTVSKIRTGGIEVEIASSNLPQSHKSPLLGVTPFKFGGAKTRSFGLSSVKISWLWLSSFWYKSRVWQTDRRTDGQASLLWLYQLLHSLLTTYYSAARVWR